MLAYKNVLCAGGPKAMYRAGDILYKECPFNYITTEEHTCRPANSNDKVVRNHVVISEDAISPESLLYEEGGLTFVFLQCPSFMVENSSTRQC